MKIYLFKLKADDLGNDFVRGNMKIRIGSLILAKVNNSKFKRNLFKAKIISIDRNANYPLSIIGKVIDDDKNDYVLITTNEILSVLVY